LLVAPLFTLAASVAAIPAFAQSPVSPQPPALDPPALTRDTARATALQFAPEAAVSYSHGDPSAEEQLLLEMINRARANPPAEGLRLRSTTDPDVVSGNLFFHVDLDQLVADFAGYPARPPLAFNASLIASARGHSQDMADNNFQGHNGSDGSA